jgi:hypothetical protein
MKDLGDRWRIQQAEKMNVTLKSERQLASRDLIRL